MSHLALVLVCRNRRQKAHRCRNLPLRYAILPGALPVAQRKKLLHRIIVLSCLSAKAASGQNTSFSVRATSCGFPAHSGGTWHTIPATHFQTAARDQFRFSSPVDKVRNSQPAQHAAACRGQTVHHSQPQRLELNCILLLRIMQHKTCVCVHILLQISSYIIH